MSVADILRLRRDLAIGAANLEGFAAVAEDVWPFAKEQVERVHFALRHYGPQALQDAEQELRRRLAVAAELMPVAGHA